MRPVRTSKLQHITKTVSVLSISSLLFYVLWWESTIRRASYRLLGQQRQPTDGLVPQLMTVACGDRLQMLLTLMKSVSLVTDSRLDFHIFTDNSTTRNVLHAQFAMFQSHVHFSVYSADYPPGYEHLKPMFKTCSSLRFFLPFMLPNVSAVIYTDVDVIFMRSAIELWRIFDEFNETQLAGLGREVLDTGGGWYGTAAKHIPHYADGLNAGIMLLNLTRIRRSDWLQRLLSISEKYKSALTVGDQDVLNIFFSQSSELLFLLPCDWNFRYDFWERHQNPDSHCVRSLVRGPGALHGNAGVFMNDRMVVLRLIYESFRDYNMLSGNLSGLGATLLKHIQATAGESDSSLFVRRILLKAQALHKFRSTITVR